jgi:hypothetical protein
MTSGYSGTLLAKKLGIKEGFLVLAINAPEDYMELLAPIPANVRFVTSDGPPWPDNEISNGFDLIHLFTNSRDELMVELSESMRHLKKHGSFWVSWYKRAAKMPTDITEDVIRAVCLPLGLVDVKVCAVDEKWSGLKLVIRKENRV